MVFDGSFVGLGGVFFQHLLFHVFHGVVGIGKHQCMGVLLADRAHGQEAFLCFAGNARIQQFHPVTFADSLDLDKGVECGNVDAGHALEIQQDGLVLVFADARVVPDPVQDGIGRAKEQETAQRDDLRFAAVVIEDLVAGRRAFHRTAVVGQRILAMHGADHAVAHNKQQQRQQDADQDAGHETDEDHGADNNANNGIVDGLKAADIFVHPFPQGLESKQENGRAHQQLGHVGDQSTANRGHHQQHHSGDQGHPAAGSAKALVHVGGNHVGVVGWAADQAAQHVTTGHVFHFIRRA